MFVGIGTLTLTLSGEKPVSRAGLKEISDTNHSPDSTLNCKILSKFVTRLFLNGTLNVWDTFP